MVSIVRAASAAALIASSLACSGDSTSPQEQVASVDVQPRDAALFLFALWPHMHQTAHNSAGREIKAPATWASSNAAKVTVDPSTGTITGVDTGSAVVTASVTAGGVTKTGSSLVTVVEPSNIGGVTATTSAVFTPQLMTVTRKGAAATVTWTFQGVAHTVTWDSQPAGASVASIDASSNTAIPRDFTVAGTYEYHCAIHSGMTGSLLVQ